MLGLPHPFYIRSYSNNSNLDLYSVLQLTGYLDYVPVKTASSSATGIALPSEKTLNKILSLLLEDINLCCIIYLSRWKAGETRLL